MRNKDLQTQNKQTNSKNVFFKILHYFSFNFKIKEAIFRKQESGAEFGTTQWALNVLNITNVKKGPTKSYNAYKDFNDKETDAQICAVTIISKWKI